MDPKKATCNDLLPPEVYNVNIPPAENSRIVVDTRSIHSNEMEYDQYKEQRIQKEDTQLIEEALQRWFEDLISSVSRLAGSDPDGFVGRLLRENIKFKFAMGATLKY
jgi:hypothetical protein